MKTIISKSFLILLFLFFSQTIYSQINGRNATLVKYATGYFKQTNVKLWIEYSSSGHQYQFNERFRDDWSIYLIDKNRNISIQLDLHQKAIYINYDRSNRAKIYSITNSSAVQVPISRPINNDTGPQGYTKCANEGDRYTFNTLVDVAYGAKGKYIYKRNVSGTILFSNATFNDPIPNTTKFGYFKKIRKPIQNPTPNPPISAVNPISTSDMNIMMAWIAGEVANSKTEYCYKESYGRGVGSPLSKCPRGFEKNGALCYPKCQSGYYGVGPVCWQKCPRKFRNDGAYCAKPGSYGRGVGYPWKFGDKPFSLNAARKRCLKANPQGCQKSGEIIYPKCKPGYKAVGCCVCSPICPSGMTDIGVSCQKKSYGRTAGKPMVCSSGLENDAGLCYQRCRANYKGVGPVCWKRCPKNQPVDCGAGCAKSTADCVEKTANQVTAVAEFAANIISLGATSKFSAAKAGLKTALKAGDKVAAKAALKITVKELANGFEQLTTRLVARKIKEKFKKESAEWVVKEYAKTQMKLVMQEEFSTEDLRDLAGLDPTGIGGVVDAFWQPICSDPKPFPRLSKNYLY